MVTRADKGQITVVMDKKDYFDKMDLLLGDQTTYKELNKDPLKKLTNKINELVKLWRKNNLINDLTYKNLNCTNGNLPRCYGLPKIHKDGFPLIIIVSALGIPIFGTHMSSPPSPILADMVMDDLETQCLNSLNFTVPIYYRFVDDVFAIVPRTRIDEMLTKFNNYHERLRFTYEMEIDSSISFLNVKVIRSKTRLITNWFRKPTWSGRTYHP
ncbi:uncharacterized protein LOC112638326 [Camponotus floridanus]|uniref:uncharacterized protein LOC112638326 n=1 Tax=Camponotus floridanus TaxID=104421 RepID=UPI000DC68D07|nr:uncharacterized protein LOC112638326 [Camponotus floridanus]